MVREERGGRNETRACMQGRCRVQGEGDRGDESAGTKKSAMDWTCTHRQTLSWAAITGGGRRLSGHPPRRKNQTRDERRKADEGEKRRKPETRKKDSVGICLYTAYGK